MTPTQALTDSWIQSMAQLAADCDPAQVVITLSDLRAALSAAPADISDQAARLLSIYCDDPEGSDGAVIAAGLRALSGAPVVIPQLTTAAPQSVAEEIGQLLKPFNATPRDEWPADAASALGHLGGMTPTQALTPQALMELADDYARCAATAHVESLYGTSKSYTAECKKYENEARSKLCAALSAAPVPAEPAPEGWRLVPVEPTPEMWGGLARDIVMWLYMYTAPHHGSWLHAHLRNVGREIPDWLSAEIPDKAHTPAKGSVAVAIYRAMLAAAPAAPKE